MIDDLDDASPATNPAAQSRPRRPLWVAGGLALVLATGGTVFALSGRGGDDELPRQRPEATFRLADMAAGESEFSLATPTILAPGKEVQIVSVKAAYSPNVEYLGAFAVWPRDHRGTTFAGGPGFPSPRQKVHHPLDAVIPPSETAFVPEGQTEPQPVTVTLGFRLLSGAGAVNGVTIVYKIDGKSTTEHFRHAVTGCVKPEPCDHDDPEFNSDLLRRYGLVKD